MGGCSDLGLGIWDGWDVVAWDVGPWNGLV